MKTAELRTKSFEELGEFLKAARSKVAQLQFDLYAGKVKNIHEIREKKKEIARILTIRKEKQQ